MKAGNLRERITIQQRTDTYNILNEPIPIWSNFASVWAEVLIGNGREYWGAKKLNSEISGIIKIRYCLGIDETMRVIVDSSYLNAYKALYTAIFKLALQSNGINSFEILNDVAKYFIAEKTLQLFYNNDSIVTKIVSAIYDGESTTITVNETVPELITKIRFVDIYQIAAPPIDIGNRHDSFELHIKKVS